METWNAIRAERESLVDALAGLADSTWDRPSLCTGWSVREVVAHLISTAQLTPSAFFGKLIANGFRFQAMTAANIRRVLDGHGNAELAAPYRSQIDARTAPPGPATSWLGETIVHGEDIFRAFGGYRNHQVGHVTAVADFYAASNLLIGAKNRAAVVRLQATDADWGHGTGPTVSGPAIALVMAMTGRKSTLDDLSGDGIAVLRNRT